MYTSPNFPSKAALKRAVKAGEVVTLFAPGLGTPNRNGYEYVEGPHYPQPHSWYAKVQVEDGIIVRVCK